MVKKKYIIYAQQCFQKSIQRHFTARIRNKSIKYSELLQLLNQFPWQRLWSPQWIVSTGLSTFWFRLKHLNFNLWQPQQNNSVTMCLMKKCTKENPDLNHIFWECRRPKTILKRAIKYWTKINVIYSFTDYKQYFFALHPPPFPQLLLADTDFQRLWKGKKTFLMVELIYRKLWSFL